MSLTYTHMYVYFDGTMTHVAYLLMANRTYLFLSFYLCYNSTKDEDFFLHLAWCNNFSLSFSANLLSWFLYFDLRNESTMKWFSQEKNFSLSRFCVHYYVQHYNSKIDRFYQNGIRDYVCISHHSERLIFFLLILIVRFASLENNNLCKNKK